jgi:transposase InsO family protein
MAPRQGLAVHLSAIVDPFSRRVVDLAMDERMDQSLVLRALNMTLGPQVVPQSLHHSDRGSQYASDDYRRALADADISNEYICAISRKQALHTPLLTVDTPLP